SRSSPFARRSESSTARANALAPLLTTSKICRAASSRKPLAATATITSRSVMPRCLERRCGRRHWRLWLSSLIGGLRTEERRLQNLLLAGTVKQIDFVEGGRTSRDVQVPAPLPPDAEPEVEIVACPEGHGFQEATCVAQLVLPLAH